MPGDRVEQRLALRAPSAWWPSRQGYRRSALAFRAVAVTWPDDVDEILASDLAAGVRLPDAREGRGDLADGAPGRSATARPGRSRSPPRRGCGRSSRGSARNPAVAVAYHARDHGLTDRPGYVLVQGRAELPDRARSRLAGVDHAGVGAVPRPEAQRPRRAHDATSTTGSACAITIQVERIVAYPDDAATEEPEVFGAPLAERAEAAERAEGRDRAARRPGEARGAGRQAAAHAARLVRRRRAARGRPGLGGARPPRPGRRLTVPTGLGARRAAAAPA